MYVHVAQLRNKCITQYLLPLYYPHLVQILGRRLEYDQMDDGELPNCSYRDILTTTIGLVSGNERSLLRMYTGFRLSSHVAAPSEKRSRDKPEYCD